MASKEQVEVSEPPDNSPLATNHAISVISSLWSYRTAHGLRHEYWLLQACFLAAKTLLPGASEYDSVQVSYFTKACQLLYWAGEHLPLANYLLRTIREFAAHENRTLPSSTARIFSGLVPRTKTTIIQNVRAFLPPPPSPRSQQDRHEQQHDGGRESDRFSRENQNMMQLYNVEFLHIITKAKVSELDIRVR